MSRPAESEIKSTQEPCPLNTRAMASKSDGFMVWRLLYFIKITALFLFLKSLRQDHQRYFFIYFLFFLFLRSKYFIPALYIPGRII